jgi:alpha-L-rhamnosidase
MILSDLKTNRMTKPLGFDLGCPRLSFIASDTGAPALARMRITVSKNPDLADPVCDSGWTDRIDTLAWPVAGGAGTVSPGITGRSRGRRYPGGLRPE